VEKNIGFSVKQETTALLGVVVHVGGELTLKFKEANTKAEPRGQRE